MKQKNKQNKKRQARRNTRTVLGKCSTQTWLDSSRTRPKTVVLTLHRNSSGAYTLEEATILKPVNQYGVIPVSADVRAIKRDINRRGLVVR
jgi:hypothetical protein